MKKLLVLVALRFFVRSGARQAPSYKSLKYPPLKQVKIPEPVEVTLSNGMRVFLLEDHELPLMRGVALVRTGNLFDPPDKRGVRRLDGRRSALRRHAHQDRRSDRRRAGKHRRVGGKRHGRNQRQRQLFRTQGNHRRS